MDKIKPAKWSYWMPDEGETADNAHNLWFSDPKVTVRQVLIDVYDMSTNDPDSHNNDEPLRIALRNNQTGWVVIYIVDVNYYYNQA